VPSHSSERLASVSAPPKPPNFGAQLADWRGGAHTAEQIRADAIPPRVDRMHSAGSPLASLQTSTLISSHVHMCSKISQHPPNGTWLKDDLGQSPDSCNMARLEPSRAVPNTNSSGLANRLKYVSAAVSSTYKSLRCQAAQHGTRPNDQKAIYFAIYSDYIQP
jgi:hypothetical protein